MRIIQVGLDATTLTFLRESGFVIEDTGPIDNVEELESWIAGGQYNAVVLNLDSGNFGIYAPRHLRKKKIAIALIGVAKGSPERTWAEERATFLENGGDDLLHNPPNPRELAASLRAMSRRFHGSLLSISEFRFGSVLLKVNLTTRSVFVNGRDPMLTNHEREMMLHLASNPGRILSKEVMLENLYALRAEDPPEIKIIDVFICKLRKKIADAARVPNAQMMIETVRAQGYRLSPDQVEQKVA